MDRAERRRIERAQGFRRAKGKRGRRPAFRLGAEQPQFSGAEASPASNLSVARSMLWTPEEKA